MFEIGAVCGCGLGSAIYIRLTVDKVLGEYGLEIDVDYNVVSYGMLDLTGTAAEIFLTTGGWSPTLKKFKKEHKKDEWRIIELDDLNDAEEYKRKLIPVLKEKGLL